MGPYSKIQDSHCLNKVYLSLVVAHYTTISNSIMRNQDEIPSQKDHTVNHKGTHLKIPKSITTTGNIFKLSSSPGYKCNLDLPNMRSAQIMTDSDEVVYFEKRESTD